MSQIKDNKIIINQLLINYYFIKSDNKINLIFLHGWGSESSIWFEFLTFFNSKGFNCYAIDLPGFGLSDYPINEYFAKDYAQIVIEFIKKLNLVNNILIGHSHGGRTALKLATLDPSIIDRLILVNSSGIKLNLFKVNLIKRISSIVKPLFKVKILSKLKNFIYKFIGATDYQDSINSPLKDTFINLISEDLTPALIYIKLKTLIIWGDKDMTTPLIIGKILKNKIINSELKILSGGHYSFLDDKENFKNIILNFIT